MIIDILLGRIKRQEEIKLTNYGDNKMYQNTAQQSFIDNRLINAISANNFDEARKSILEGANPNCMTKYGNTPLHIAAVNNAFSIAKLLIRWGAHLTVFNEDGMTPLMVAENSDNSDLAMLLFEEEMKLILESHRFKPKDNDMVA